MRWVRPQVFLIAKTAVQNSEVADWLASLGIEPFAYAHDHVKTEAERLIELAGRRCYLSFVPGLNPNVTKIRTDIAEYLTNILRVQHGSVLEHVTFTFAIENVSRVFTGEMNRHRAGVAISEGSMRYIRFNDIPIVEVPSLQLEDNGIDRDKKKKARATIENCVKYVEGYYGDLQMTFEEILSGKEFAGKKHVTSMLRRIIPMGVATGGVWTFNVRSLRHMLTMRAAAAAEEEICVVAEQILAIMQREEPILFGDFRRGADGHFAPEYVKV